MKVNDALATVVGTSHRRIARVDLYDGGGLVEADLPVEGGQIVGSAVDADRWSADLTLSGDEWMPTKPTDPLSGLAGTWLSIHLGAEVDTVEQTVEVCRVIPITTRVRRSVEDVTVETSCVGLAGYLGLAAAGRYAARNDETCQEMIVRIIRDAAPPGWSGTVLDTTTPVQIPTGFYTDEATPAEVIADLEAVGNVASYFDATGTLIIRDPLPETFGPPVETIEVGTDLSAYDVEMGRDFGFANYVELTFKPAGASNRQRVSSDWTYRSQKGNPSAGEVRRTDNGDGTEQWRIHVRDADGKRRGRGLRSIETGDVVEALAPTGATTLCEVRSTRDEGTFITLDVEVLSTEDGGVQNNDAVELAVFIALLDDIVGTAEWSDPPLDPWNTSGRVTYTETRTGNVTQAQADARARAMLNATVRAWQTTIVEAIPDPRLEPDDDILVALPDRTLVARITRVEIPLSAQDLMTVGVRTFPADAYVPDALYPAANLYPADDLYPLGA